MIRTPRHVIEAMATAAELTDFSAAATWRDALFTDSTGAWGLSNPAAPDRAMLAGAAVAFAQLDEHLATLPTRLHTAWLEGILGIDRLPSVPDRVVAHATVTPALAPAVIPAGTMLRGGKDAFGNERRYRTLDTLTAHGAELVGVRVTVPGGPAGAAPGRALEATAKEGLPLAAEPGAVAGPLAKHVLRISSPNLAFPSGSLTAELRFTLLTPSAVAVPVPADVLWQWPLPDGTISDAVGHTPVTDGASILMKGGCADPDGGDAWIEMVVPAGVPIPEGFSFSTVTVTASRSGIAPLAAFYNDGALDVTKEFKPFGDVARRGDAFYLRSDEAFSKPLASASITVTTMAPDGTILLGSLYGHGMLNWVSAAVADAYEAEHSGSGFYIDFGDYFPDSSSPSVVWQRRSGGAWEPFGDAASDFGGVSDTLSDPVCSEPFAVSGQPGHYLRAFLSQGDFGWSQYQADLAAFAMGAAKGELDTGDEMPTPPDPVVATSITITYTTQASSATRAVATNGWHRATLGDTPFRPFTRAVDDVGTPAEVAVGLSVPDAALGSTVSVYVALDSASPCGMTDDEDTTWQWWDGTAWRTLATADGTLQLRESGLLRFVAPRDWASGCSELGAASGRWIRMITGTPGRLGTLLAVIPDAVLGEYVSAAAEPSRDPSGDTALPPGTIKGTVGAIRGVKKVTNLASVRGRAPETEAQYARRASAQVRHRGRALASWDYEQHVAIGFPEVAAVRCLPHTGLDGKRKPGSVGLVIIPDSPLDRQPRPSVSLTRRLHNALTPLTPMGAEVAVLCPLYYPVSLHAEVLLRPGVAAIDGREAVAGAIETLLHPAGTLPVRWGRTLYASTLIAALERLMFVDRVTTFSMTYLGAEVQRVEVDACRGLYCSAGDHVLVCEEQL